MYSSVSTIWVLLGAALQYDFCPQKRMHFFR